MSHPLLTALGGATFGIVGGALALLRMGSRRKLAEALRVALERAACYEALHDAWSWETDREHRIVSMRAPKRGGDADAAAAAAARHPVFLADLVAQAEAAALRDSLERRASLDGLHVAGRAGMHGPASGTLHGVVRSDADGAFAGYQGIVRDLPLPVAAAAPATAHPGASRTSEHDAFNYTLSHDLRAPIRVVEGFTRIVKEDYGRMLDRVGNDHLDRVLGAATRLNQMIDAVVALSNLSTRPLERQPVDLSAFAAAVADGLRDASPQREVQIAIEPDMRVQGDPALLHQVVEHLLGNAWKFTSRVAQPRIAFERDPLDALGFIVRDNGAGFDMRYCERLFGTFQRLHGAKDFPGIGVGLAAVRRILRRHGGEIRADAVVDGGAVFHFTLPHGADLR